MTKALRVKCVGHNSRGKPCGNWAIRGGTVCRSHGGASGHVKAKAAVRAEVMAWGFTDQTVDPGEVLLRLVTQSAARCARYSAELDADVAKEGFLPAMVGDSMVATQFDTHKSGEYIRGLAKLEAEERDRCANFAAKAIAAGLAEREVRVAERQGQEMVRMVQAALATAGVPEQYAAAFKTALAQEVRAIGAG